MQNLLLGTWLCGRYWQKHNLRHGLAQNASPHCQNLFGSAISGASKHTPYFISLTRPESAEDGKRMPHVIQSSIL
jgi:hypothetical protein